MDINEKTRVSFGLLITIIGACLSIFSWVAYYVINTPTVEYVDKLIEKSNKESMQRHEDTTKELDYIRARIDTIYDKVNERKR